MTPRLLQALHRIVTLAARSDDPAMQQALSALRAELPADAPDAPTGDVVVAELQREAGNDS